jgi:hypothetical protein
MDSPRVALEITFFSSRTLAGELLVLLLLPREVPLPARPAWHRLLIWVALGVRTKVGNPEFIAKSEPCAAFWHMLDLVRIILFPLLYSL